jgi:hypothetical protein
MKQIDYDIKNTTAKTKYVKINKNDMEWLQKELFAYTCLMGELRNHKDKRYSILVKEYWSTTHKQLPSGVNGKNTPESFVCGMLNNLVYGTQYDLSDIQMNALEVISIDMNQIYNAVRGLGLQPKTLTFEDIQFRESLFGVK